ncbi:cupin domain-containing protein [Paenibacillus oralis]|uniref:cupin domain-containing protein n=1 Tax=Paenibacillus oralis TaxID=2490856 RepID=UPI003CCC63CF
MHPKGVSLESHYHNFVEINYVYKGCCYQTINDKVEIVLNEGDILLLDSGTVHSIKATSTDDIILNCMISERYFAHYLIDKVSSNTFLNELATRIMFNSKSTYHIFRTNNNPSLRDYFQHCVKEYFYPSICSENVIDAYIMLIFSVLCRINYEQNELDKNHAAILEILNYIEKHPVMFHYRM